MSENLPAPQEPEDAGELVFYQTEEGDSRIQLRLHEGTVWLTQKLLGKLYQVSVKTVNEHLQNIYDEGELSPEATIRKFRIVQTEGRRQVARLVDHYRLEAILAIGYRVRSARGNYSAIPNSSNRGVRGVVAPWLGQRTPIPSLEFSLQAVSFKHAKA